MKHARSAFVLAAAAAFLIQPGARRLTAQEPQAARPPAQAQPRAPRPEPKMDPERARRLYVSTNPDDNSLGHDFQRDIDEKRKTDQRLAEASKGVMDFEKISYRSSVGDLDIPAYLFRRSIS